MSFEQPSSLVFSIKEAVWLTRGKEIDELLSLALEPDISIREADDQVFIRGNLHLFGEYRPKEDDDSSRTDEEGLPKQVSFRSVEEVIMTDDGIGMIRHSFPLDVTIPRERIDDLENVYVTVDSFDYELPGSGCIELEASISVAGIKGDREESAPVQPDYEELDNTIANEETSFTVNEDEPPEQVNNKDDEKRDFHFELYRQPEEVEVTEEDTETLNFQSMDRKPEEEEHQDDDGNIRGDSEMFEEENEVNEVSEESEVRDGEAEVEEQPEPEIEVVEPEPEPELFERESVEPTVNFAPYKRPETKEEVEEAVSTPTEGLDDKPQEEMDNPEVTSQAENALYLTKMLTKGEEEFSKLKLCIVQEGESIETIAERYDIQVSQLIRTNRLSEERVDEGQILYIPVKQTPASNS